MNVRLCSVRCKNENKCRLKVGGLGVRASAAEPLCDGEWLPEHCCSQGFLQPHRCSLFPKLLRLEVEELGN